jgi:undecaprenyl-diphosphatase
METRILLFIHAHASPALDALFTVSHYLGTIEVCASLVVAAIVVHLLRRERREALAWLGTGLGTYVLMRGLKALVHRPRPQLWEWLIPETNWSFPSGHALASATFYPLLAWIVARHVPAHAAAIRATGIAAALFVGFGRLYLGVHWPTDVLAGWTLGAAQAALALACLRRPATGAGRV